MGKAAYKIRAPGIPTIKIRTKAGVIRTKAGIRIKAGTKIRIKVGTIKIRIRALIISRDSATIHMRLANRDLTNRDSIIARDSLIRDRASTLNLSTTITISIIIKIMHSTGHLSLIQTISTKYTLQ